MIKLRVVVVSALLVTLASCGGQSPFAGLVSTSSSGTSSSGGGTGGSSPGGKGNRFSESSSNYYQMAHEGSCQGIPISIDPSVAAHVKDPKFDAAGICDAAMDNLRYFCGDFTEKYDDASKPLHKAMAKILRDNIKQISCTWTDTKARYRVGAQTAPVVGARVTPDKTLVLSVNDQDTAEDGSVNITVTNDYMVDFLTKGDLKAPGPDGTPLNYMQFRILFAILNKIDKGPEHSAGDYGMAEIEKACGFRIPIEVTSRSAIDEFNYDKSEEEHQSKSANYYPWARSAGWFCGPTAENLASECEGPNKPLVQKAIKKLVCDSKPGAPASFDYNPSSGTLTLYTDVASTGGGSIDQLMLPYTKTVVPLGFALNFHVTQNCYKCEAEYNAARKPRK